MRDPNNNRLVLLPKHEEQEQEFRRALDIAWKQLHWTINVDEEWYVEHKLRMGDVIDMFMTQGRDPGKFSMLCGAQRPVEISRFVLGESTHVLSFVQDGRDVRILQDATNKKFAQLVSELPQHHFAWFHRPSRQMWVGKLRRVDPDSDFIGEYA